MTGYSERVVRATRQVLLEVFQLLDQFQDSLIFIRVFGFNFLRIVFVFSPFRVFVIKNTAGPMSRRRIMLSPVRTFCLMIQVREKFSVLSGQRPVQRSLLFACRFQNI